MDILYKVVMRTFDGIQVLIITSCLFFLLFNSLSKRKYLRSFFIFIFSVFVLFFYNGIFLWIKGLGGDSFLEASDFNLSEAVSWSGSFISNLIYMMTPIKYVVLIAVESLVVSSLLFLYFKNTKRIFFFLLSVFFLGHVSLVYNTYNGFQLGQKYVKSLEAQFASYPIDFRSTDNEIDLFVYIGESTSTFNMSVYGYPLNTTPQLRRLENVEEGFIKFENVRSTHTHTSPSLLRSLSLPAKERGQFWGIGKILESAHVRASFFSVQPMTGSFASSSKFIFSGMKQFAASGVDKYVGNLARPSVLDHQMLDDALKKRGVVFFHSYAGHIPYLKFIDMNKSSFVDRPQISRPGVIGNAVPEIFAPSVISDVSDYDRAITYIDHNLSGAIEVQKNKNTPSVLIYFSDHGESVYTRRAHDSSMFIDEMSTVPFIIYFNEAYMKRYPDVFSKYKKAASGHGTRILDQLMPTLLDVARVTYDGHMNIRDVSLDIEEHYNPIIIERETVSGRSGIDLKVTLFNKLNSINFIGGTPFPTWLFVLNQSKQRESNFCYHRSNSYAKTLRAASVSKCFEVDLVVENGELHITHPPLPNTGFTLEHVFQIAEYRKNSIWIDGKNLNEPLACEGLLAFLERNRQRVGDVFVEFPSSTTPELANISECAKGIKGLGAKTSYYVPPIEDKCFKLVNSDKYCMDFKSNIISKINSDIFTDLSFDISSLGLIRSIPNARKLKWNTWLVDVKDLDTIDVDTFGYVIVNTADDPNGY